MTTTEDRARRNQIRRDVNNVWRGEKIKIIAVISGDKAEHFTVNCSSPWGCFVFGITKTLEAQYDRNFDVSGWIMRNARYFLETLLISQYKGEQSG